MSCGKQSNSPVTLSSELQITTEGTQHHVSNAVEKVKHFDIVIVLLGVIIALLIGNIAFVGYTQYRL